MPYRPRPAILLDNGQRSPRKLLAALVCKLVAALGAQNGRSVDR